MRSGNASILVIGETNDDQIFIASTSLMAFLLNKSALTQTNIFHPYCNLTGSKPTPNIFAEKWKEKPTNGYHVTLQSSNRINLYVFSETETKVTIVSLKDFNLVDKVNEDSDLYEMYDVKVYFSQTDGWFSWYDAASKVVVTRKCKSRNRIFKW